MARMSGVTDGCGVSVGVEVRVKSGRGTRVEVGVGNGFVVGISFTVAAVSVCVIGEVPHATNSSRHAHMPKLRVNRLVLMLSVYNGLA